MSARSVDWLFEHAADALLSAMTSETGSADERRYMSAVRIFMLAAEKVPGDHRP
jgi:hypothetical protein